MQFFENSKQELLGEIYLKDMEIEKISTADWAGELNVESFIDFFKPSLMERPTSYYYLIVG